MSEGDNLTTAIVRLLWNGYVFVRRSTDMSLCLCKYNNNNAKIIVDQLSMVIYLQKWTERKWSNINANNGTKSLN